MHPAKSASVYKHRARCHPGEQQTLLAQTPLKYLDMRHSDAIVHPQIYLVQEVTRLANVVTMSDGSGLVSRDTQSRRIKMREASFPSSPVREKVLFSDRTFWDMRSGNTPKPALLKPDQFSVSIDDGLMSNSHVVKPSSTLV